MAKFGESSDLVKCSFCGKPQKEVKKLIAGPGIYICDECVDLCASIVQEETTDGPKRTTPLPSPLSSELKEQASRADRVAKFLLRLASELEERGLSSTNQRVVVTDFTEREGVTSFLDGSSRTVVHIGPSLVGRGSYLPGWRWSEHVKPVHGRESERHTGYVLSGSLAVQDSDGHQVVVRPGQAFFAPSGHDAWVIGDGPCVTLDFLPA